MMACLSLYSKLISIFSSLPPPSLPPPSLLPPAVAQFIRPPIRTICVGQAFGTAAMILSLGQKGNRFALPNASIMLNQPRSRARGQASDVAIKVRGALLLLLLLASIWPLLYPPPLAQRHTLSRLSLSTLPPPFNRPRRSSTTAA